MIWPAVRDVILFLGGLSGIGYQTVTEDRDPIMTAVFGAMLGLPAFIRTDQRRTQ